MGIHVLPEMPSNHRGKVGNYLSESWSWGWERKWEVTVLRTSLWHEDACRTECSEDVIRTGHEAMGATVATRAGCTPPPPPLSW